MEADEIKNINWEDGKTRVLILGNGLSRKNYSDIPKEWKGEIWACNWAYKEYIDGNLPRLDVLIGDYACLKYVVKYRDKELKDTVIYGKAQKSVELPGVQYPDSERSFFSDSGSTIVVHALKKRYDEIYLIGFDLGGKDLYQRHHHLRNKKMWLRNWRQINKRFGLSKIHFIGYDHKKIIQSVYPDDYYAQKYMRGRDHLDGYYSYQSIDLLPDGTVQHNKKKTNRVLIVGNGKTRNTGTVRRFIKSWNDEIWGCNYIFQEYKEFPRLDRVGITYNKVLQDVAKFARDNDVNFHVYANTNTDLGDNIETKVFQDYRKYFTGQQMILQALYEDYDDIYLVGFDFGGVDVYNRKTVKWNEIVEQTREIIREFGFSRLHFVGGLPKFLV